MDSLVSKKCSMCCDETAIETYLLQKVGKAGVPYYFHACLQCLNHEHQIDASTKVFVCDGRHEEQTEQFIESYLADVHITDTRDTFYWEPNSTFGVRFFKPFLALITSPAIYTPRR